MKKTLSVILALAMILTMFAGCGGSAVTEPELEPISEPDAAPVSVPAAVEGVVKEASPNKIIVTLADGTNLAIDTTGIADLDVGPGDTVKVECTGEVGSMAASKVEIIEKAKIATVTVTGVVTRIEDGFVYLTLEDGTEAALKTESVGEYDVEVGDTLTIEYVDDDTDGGVDVVSVEVTKAEKEVQDTTASQTTQGTPTGAASGSGTTSGSAGSFSSSSPSSGSSSSSNSGVLITERSVEEGRAWYRAAIDLGGALDNLVTFVKGEDVYPYGTSLYNAYYNFFMYEWDGVSDWKTVSLNGNGSNYDDDDDDEDDYVASNKSSSSSSSSGGSSKSQGQAEAAEGVGDVYEAIRLINAERKNAGLPELKIDSELMEMAAVRASEISKDYEGTGIKHYRPNGEYFLSIFDEYDWKYSWAEENVDASQATAAKTVSRWMNSAVHKANILNDEITRIGLGYYYDSNSDWKYHWVMLAGNPLK